jgi:branched-chain amino acid aminotransferase
MISETLKIEVEKAADTRVGEVDFNNIKFGRQFADHMFVAQYDNQEWGAFQIRPYDELKLYPSCLALHYGQTIFEGMKAYKNADGEVLLFRPLDNFRRLNRSAARMCMPEINPELMLEALTQLLVLDKNWIPPNKGASLYIRPFMFAIDEYVGVRPSEKYSCIIFTCPVGPYYSTPLKVKIEMEYTRAANGGTGHAKAGGNYGAALYPAKLAQDEGYHQLIWTDSKEHKYIEESGTMNIMFQIGDKLITPPVGSTILEGITRDSVICLALDEGFIVEERPVTVDEIVEAYAAGNLNDAFGIGTAATIAPIELIGHEGSDMILPTDNSQKLSTRLSERLNAIRYGEAEDKFGWMTKLNI